MFVIKFVFIFSFLLTFARCFRSSDQSTLRAPKCKAIPRSSAWPSDELWKRLNVSVSGRLLMPLPPAAVCDPTLCVFDDKACSGVTRNWTSSNYHASDPVSVQQPNWEHDACLPTSTHPCNTSQFPVYVINATEACHVQAGVKFANENRIRLNVKGTGHDYLGR